MNGQIVVTISREYGAEGHEIGKALSLRLGVKLYDKDILGLAAQKQGTEKNLINAVDERVAPRFSDPFLLWRMGTTNRNDDLFLAEEAIIRDLAASESCVIVGRLSDYLLRQEPHAIKVAVFAPRDFRIHNIQSKYGLSESVAKAQVRRRDEMRQSYCRYYSGGKWPQAAERDLLLNRATLGIDGCVSVILAAVQARSKALYGGD
ncbi:cytidylate kinase-like family protein [Oscillospiraceae bacterium HV4-5-C5C]|nr:cytidylate kinase-like family protein [Oscillospiraceae bacterium HV4-5-C5C]